MTELILPPDAEDALRVALAAKLEEVLGRKVPCHLDVPASRPAEFIVVRNVGGTRRNVATFVPTLVVEAWSLRKSKAWELAATVQALMHWFTDIGGYTVYDVEEYAGPAWLPDSLTDHARYTATYAVPIRARALGEG